MREHCLPVMDGFKIWRYYFPSFLETNWTFIAYILKIRQSSGEADVSFIEAHREVRSHRINFPVLLLPQEDVWKMPAPLNWFTDEFITWGVQAISRGPVCCCCCCFSFTPHSFPFVSCLKALSSQSFAPLCSSLKPILLSVLRSTLPPPPHPLFFAQKMHLISWVLGGFTNIAIKQSQCFYCALDLKIGTGLTAGSRRNLWKRPCLCLPVRRWMARVNQMISLHY